MVNHVDVAKILPKSNAINVNDVVVIYRRYKNRAIFVR